MRTQTAKENKPRSKPRDEMKREIIESLSRFSEPVQQAIACIFEEAFSPKHEGRAK